MRPLLILTAGDLRQRVRDRSVLIFGIVVPIALMAVMNLVFADAEEIEFDHTTVAVAKPDDDQLAQVVVDVLGQVDVLEVTVTEVASDQVEPRVDAGQADMGLVIPDDFTATVTQGDGATLEVVQGEGAGVETDILTSVIQSVTDRFTSAAVAQQAGAELGMAEQELARAGQQVGQAEAVVTTTEGETATEQLGLGATMVAGQAGLFLLFTVGFAVLALINEREQGTLTRLYSMPLRRGLVVAAKALSAYVLGVAATSVLLVAGSLMFGVSFGAIPLVGLLVLCVVAAATSLSFIVARVARTAEQAGVTQAILAVVLGMFGGAFFQVSGDGVAGVLLDLNPIGAFTRGLGIVAGGGGLGDLGVPIGTMLGFAVIATVISRLVPDRGAQL